jgi:hypothetical protein
MPEQSTVIGIFEEREAMRVALASLHQAGFHDEQLGFIARHDTAQEVLNRTGTTGSHPNAVLRGVVGGILGVVDVLLAPFTGPADANTILTSTLPVAEEVIDRLPYPGSHSTEATQRTQTETTPSPTTHSEEQPELASEERTSIFTGGAVGGAMGLVAALLIPGIGPVVAGGVLAAVLGGAGLGSVAGGFLGAFVNLGIPEQKARHYEQELRAGRTIVTVHADTRQREAVDILRQHGARDVEVH